MDDVSTRLTELAAVASRSADAPASTPDVTIWRSSAPTAPVPALFEPVFYLVLQGAKRLTFAGDAKEFGAGTYAIATVGLPFVHEVVEASAARPYVGVQVRLEPAVVSELLLGAPDPIGTPIASFATAAADAIVLEPLGRLLRLLATPADAAVLAPGIVRELCYRLLQGPLGATLAQVGRRGSRFAQVRRAADWIGAHADEPLRIPELAASVGLSVTSLHRHFKAVTGYSPLAYQRYLRLVEARRLLASGERAVSSAAFAVGYASASQFSREYKRMFGLPPIADARPMAAAGELA